MASTRKGSRDRLRLRFVIRLRLPFLFVVPVASFRDPNTNPVRLVTKAEGAISVCHHAYEDGALFGLA